MANDIFIGTIEELHMSELAKQCTPFAIDYCNQYTQNIFVWGLVLGAVIAVSMLYVGRWLNGWIQSHKS